MDIAVLKHRRGRVEITQLPRHGAATRGDVQHLIKPPVIGTHDRRIQAEGQPHIRQCGQPCHGPVECAGMARNGIMGARIGPEQAHHGKVYTRILERACRVLGKLEGGRGVERNKADALVPSLGDDGG